MSLVNSLLSLLSITRHYLRQLMTLSMACLSISSISVAAPWPEEKPIKLIVPFSAGGSTDVIARVLADNLATRLNQSVIVENRAGANGAIGANLVAKAKGDGYTLLMSGIGSNATNYAMYPDLPYRPADFKQVAMVALGPNVLVVNPAFPANSVGELVAVLKAHPGEYAYASPGAGSSLHLAMELFKQRKDVDAYHVPYRGMPQVITDLISGQVPMAFLNASSALPYVKDHKLRALAITSRLRNHAFPGVSTMDQVGVSDFDVLTWFGIAVPASTPDDIVDKLSELINSIVSKPDIKKIYEASSLEITLMSPQQTSDFVNSEIQKWTKVIESSALSAK